MSIVSEIRRKWKPRRPDSHKGNFGRVLIAAGSRGMSGAAHLAGLAALRAGAGLVTLAVPDKIHPIVARRQDELMVRPFPSSLSGSFSFNALKSLLALLQTQDVLALGPGLSQYPETRRLVLGLIKKTQLPLVLDADALNALKGNLSVLKSCQFRAVLTPHPGEFLRLFGGKLSSSDSIRKKRAAAIAKQYRLILVLKGFHTVVASPEGKVYVNQTGNPGMATAGTGDVLTGVIAALMGQGFSLWDAARFGVYLHGLAGDLAAKKMGQVSLVAGDLIEFLPSAIRNVTRR